MRALITGGGGFVGQWLTRAMLSQGDDVVCADLTPAPPADQLTAAERAAVQWLPMDIRDDVAVGTAVGASKPDVVFHLAGISFVPDAQKSPIQTYEVNAVGTARLLACLSSAREQGVCDPTVLIVGSAEQYGRHSAESMPLHEDAAQHPVTAYAASKTAQEIFALQQGRSDGLRVIATRSFNHSGVGQSANFLIPALVRRALDARAGGQQQLLIGNGTPIRDFLHVQDVVSAYLLLAKYGEAGAVYNVCSGVGISVHELAERVLSRVGVQATVATDPTLVRAIDVPILIGSAAKIMAATGWAETRSTDDIIDDLIHAATK